MAALPNVCNMIHAASTSPGQCRVLVLCRIPFLCVEAVGEFASAGSRCDLPLGKACKGSHYHPSDWHTTYIYCWRLSKEMNDLRPGLCDRDQT